MPQNKIWFVTGASSGFGRIWTEAALRRGDSVFATSRDASVLSDLTEKFGDQVATASLDVTDRASVFDAVRAAHERFGRLDVILSNAGYSYTGAVEELDFDDAKANFDTNVFGTLSVIQAALPFLRAQGGGHIVTLSSVGGIVAFPTGGAYVATKFAVEALSESLAAEVAGFGIRVTIVEPGSFRTGFGSAVKVAPRMPEYDPVRAAVYASFSPDTSGDPAATAGAILELVDSEHPPLRLILGDWVLDRFAAAYADRLATWQSWAEVSKAAQR